MYKLQKSCAATSSENCIDAFVTHSHPALPFFFLPGVFGDPMWKERGLSKPLLSVTDFKTWGPRPSVSPNHHICEAPAETSCTGGKIFDLFSFARINSHTNDRWERGKGSRRTGGGWWGAWGSEEEHQRDKTKAALDLGKSIPTSVLNTVPFIFQCTADIYQLWEYSQLKLLNYWI